MAGGPSGAPHLVRSAGVCLVIAFLVMFISWGMRAMSALLPGEQIRSASMCITFPPMPCARQCACCATGSVAALYPCLCDACCQKPTGRANVIPILDILQSVPVLGYISFTVTGFIALFPGSMMGVECAAIFAIFTSQAWNMTFSLYQSLKSIPRDMDEAAFAVQAVGWQKFWKMGALRYAGADLEYDDVDVGRLVFVVASEAITVGNQHITLPGSGSYRTGHREAALGRSAGRLQP